MGTGLGAIIRLSSRFDIYTSEGGTILLSRVGGGADRPSWDVGAICVPCPGESVSGDAWVVAHGTNRASVLMVDGLGHGEGAHAAAQEAVRIFSANAGHSPSSILEKLHQGLRHTRGAAGAVLELDGRDRVARFAGVGNISARLLHQGVSHSMVSNHGTLGHLVRHTNEFTYPWPERALVILHSDGIGTRWDLSRYPGLEPRHPMLIAGTLYRDFSRRRDDATVLAFREAS